MTSDNARAPFLAGKRRIIVYVAIALLIILVLRENGLITLSLYQSQDTYTGVSSSTKTSISDTVTPPAGAAEVKEAASVRAPAVTEVTVYGDRIAAKTVETWLRENAQVQASGARIDVVDLSVNGLYWLPLHKSGRCRFSATMQRDDKATGKYRGNISGTIDLTVNGLCSAHQYRQMMGEKVAEKIRDCVSKDLRGS